MAGAGIRSEARAADPRKKIDEAVIASPPHRRQRAAVFQVYVLMAAVVFVVLAISARTVPYFPLDLHITLAIQRDHGFGFENLLAAISWIGFPPQGYILGAVVILSLYFAGLRWEAVATSFAALGIGVGTITKIIVHRPRPSADLVRVIRQLPPSGFPSGHVLFITTFGGFLAFLCYTLLKPSWGRSLLLVFSGLLIVLMGISRIELGAHWFSDVMGAYVLGSLWLALTIRFYRWGKPRYFVHQPVAPAEPAERA